MHVRSCSKERHFIPFRKLVLMIYFYLNEIYRLQFVDLDLESNRLETRIKRVIRLSNNARRLILQCDLEALSVSHSLD